MSLIGEYLGKNWDISKFQQELGRLVSLYNETRKSCLLVYACPTDKPIPQASVIREDYYVIQDFLANIKGDKLDVYLETPGGRGDVTEDIVKCFRSRFENVSFIIAGEAKSAGTIMALSGDEIYMTETGSLGPIDAQTRIGRSTVSTSDYIEWIEQKREDAVKNGRLNPLDAMIVAQISPGELNGVLHQNKFAQDRVIEWLPKYKFKNWKVTKGRGLLVTDEMKKRRAEEIAGQLAANSQRWRIHGKSIKIEDLKDLLLIHRVEDNAVFKDIIYRIHAVCRFLFDMHGTFKIFATSNDMMFRTAKQIQPSIPLRKGMQKPEVLKLDLDCNKCRKKYMFYVKFVNDVEIDKDMKKRGVLPLPSGDEFTCGCGQKHDLMVIKEGIEKKTGIEFIS